MKRLHGIERVAMVFTGIHVPHAQAHVVPMHEVHDLTSQACLGEGLKGFSALPRLPQDRMAGIARERAQD